MNAGPTVGPTSVGKWLTIAAKAAPTWLCLVPLAVLADYQAGLDAYGRGDYGAAMREWRVVTDGPASAVNPAIYAEAHYGVAMLYWQGHGVATDFRQAYDWLLKAAELGHADAQAKLGFMYTDGTAVARDHHQAFGWFSKAAEGGSVDGLYNLGVFYLYGWAVEQDLTMAAQYLAAAAALGDEAAEEALPQVLAQIKQERAGPASAGAKSAELVADAIGAAEAAPMGGGEADVAVAAEAAPAAEQPTGVLLLDESWIRAQDPQRYTIQVIALSSKPRLEELVRGFEDAGPFAYYVVQKQSKPLYVLLQGSYADADGARAARSRIPRAIQNQDELLVRRFGMYQESLD